MSRVLVTGGAGFVGSHLVDLLIEKSYDVDTWDSLTTGKEENINPKANFTNVDCCYALVPNLKPYDVIFHLAAEPRIQPSFSHPALTFQSNVMGTENVLEAATNSKARVVYAGSSTAYSSVYLNPYAFTKWMGEETCKLFNQIYKVPVAIARFFNVYGPRQLDTGPYSTVVGIFERQKRNREPLTVTGDGQQRRDFTHVSDIARGLYAMSELDWNGEVFNLGTGKNYSIAALAMMFKPGTGIKHLPARPGEAQSTLADIRKSKEYLDWEPKVDLEEYVANFVLSLQREANPDKAVNSE